MDEMQLVKDLRRSTPAITEDAESVARTRLLAMALDSTASRPSRGQAGRTSVRRKVAWRAAVAGALAATVAVGFTVAQHSGGAAKESVTDTAPVQVLDHAAATAKGRPFTAPRPDQWVYVEVLNHTLPQSIPGMPLDPGRTDKFELWNQASGKGQRLALNGSGTTDPHPVNFPPQAYETLTTLPTDPGALMRWLHAHRPSWDASSDFQILGGILAAAVVPPRLEATIFREMKTLPGVTIRRGVKDLDGRSVIGVVGLGGGPGDFYNLELMLDPVTYAYVGYQDYPNADVHRTTKEGRHFVIKAGTVNIISMLTRTGIVDKPGQTP